VILSLFQWSASKSGLIFGGNYSVFRYTVNGRQLDRGNGNAMQAERPFNVSSELLSMMGFPMDLNDVTSLAESDFAHFVFVTAASSDHFHEGMDAISRVQQHFPNYTLYFYDLDTNTPDSTVKKVCFYSLQRI
jgi:Protein of unknown function (DUF1647)